MTACPGLKHSEVEGRLLVSLEPLPGSAPLDAEALRALLVDAGYGALFFFEEALLKLVEGYNAAVASFELPVAERRDASFSLDISEDAMTVEADFLPAYGGKALTPDDLFAALVGIWVTYGLDQSAVDAICQAKSPGRLVLAAGTPAIDGEPTRFELLATDTRDRSPQMDEHGLIDFRELGAIPLVVAEQPLMRRIPPTPGVAGRNVRGEPVAPIAGRSEFFAENLVGAYVSADDPNLLLAVFNGQPIRCGNGVMVEQVLHLGSVNVATGNINFDGSVHINGDVLPGMKVHATGDIVVTGVVDAGELDAGGDVRVGGGIIAQSSVRAGGAVAARFVENAHVHAGTTIAIDDAALQADLQAMNQILIGLKSTQRGRLVGGSARAMLLVQTPFLGAASGGVTAVQLGVNPVLEARYKALQQRLEKQKAGEADLEKLLKHLNAHGDKGGMLARVKASWQESLQIWARLLLEKEALEDQLELIHGARLQVGVAVAGAIDIAFGKKSFRLRRNFDSGVFSLKSDKVVFSDTEGGVSVVA